MKNILIVDDDKEILDLIKLYMYDEKFNIFEANNGEDALKLVTENKIDIALIDIMMPKINGYDLLKQIRKEYTFPVIMVSAKFEVKDKVLCLSLGADDYITKPFDPLELVARVKAQLRRGDDYLNSFEKAENSLAHETIICGDLKLDIKECLLYKSEMAIEISAMEFKLLKKFMQSPGRVFTKNELYFDIWNNKVVDDNTLMVTISKIRSKIGEEKIKTIRGLGYKFNKE